MKFTITGTPKPLKRPRIARHGGFFDPSYKDKLLVGQIALAAHLKFGSGHLKGDLMACMTFYAADKRRRDIDNLIKLIFDACNKVIFDDDSQIVRVIAAKERCEKNEERTEVEIYPIKP